MTSQRPWAHRWPSRALVGIALLCASLGGATRASAATARVTWLPRSGVVTGYSIYARNAGSSYGTGAPIWTGNPTPAADGSLSATVTFTPSSSGTNYFSVVAVSATTGESGLSNEKGVGPQNQCRNDACVTKTACDFTTRPDGSSCDDNIFCNGPEVCRAGTCDTSAVRNCADAISCTTDTCDEAAGKCVHTGPPGCCLACDSLDPCLAKACATGDCSAAEGATVDVNRIRFLSKKGEIKLAAKGSFGADESLDPSETGVSVEFFTVDGTRVYAATLFADDVKAGSTGRFRYQGGRSDFDPFKKGITRLDFRRKHDQWLVTLKAETVDLTDAFLEPTLTWVIKVGDTCARRMDMPCNQTSAKSVCR
jgi:hypothetical protein